MRSLLVLWSTLPFHRYQPQPPHQHSTGMLGSLLTRTTYGAARRCPAAPLGFLPGRIRQPSPWNHVAPPQAFAPRFLSKSAAKPLSKGQKRKRAKERRQRESEKQKAKNAWLDRERKLKRQQGLAKPAKFKRILSRCDYWFSKSNLMDDQFFREKLKEHNGWMPIRTLLTFRKFQHWTSAELLCEAFSCSNSKRYELKYPYQEENHESALVRHTRVSLQTIEEIEEENAEMAARLEFGEEDEGFFDDMDEDDYEVEEDFDEDDFDEDDAVEPMTIKEMRALKNYKTDREIVVIRDRKKLDAFIKDLKQALETYVLEWNGREEARVIGFDVEYATLEEDIRSTLPAMIQLAAPTPDGPIGLIWLDEFPFHGRNFLNIPGEYKSLLNILQDPKILKVGVSASKDAINLASWWGINDREYVDHFICGVIDLEKERDADVQGFKLDEMCALFLHRNLPKQKAKKRDEKISHWRANELTKKMKEYAAHDAACAVDVWMAMKGLVRDDKE